MNTDTIITSHLVSLTCFSLLWTLSGQQFCSHSCVFISQLALHPPFFVFLGTFLLIIAKRPDWNFPNFWSKSWHYSLTLTSQGDVFLVWKNLQHKEFHLNQQFLEREKKPSKSQSNIPTHPHIHLGTKCTLWKDTQRIKVPYWKTPTEPGVHYGRTPTRRESRILKWGVSFCNNIIEPKPGWGVWGLCINIWGIRKKKKGAQKKGGENSPISPPLDPRLTHGIKLPYGKTPTEPDIHYGRTPTESRYPMGRHPQNQAYITGGHPWNQGTLWEDTYRTRHTLWEDTHGITVPCGKTPTEPGIHYGRTPTESSYPMGRHLQNQAYIMGGHPWNQGTLWEDTHRTLWEDTLRMRCTTLEVFNDIMRGYKNLHFKKQQKKNIGAEVVSFIHYDLGEHSFFSNFWLCYCGVKLQGFEGMVAHLCSGVACWDIGCLAGFGGREVVIVL